MLGAIAGDMIGLPYEKRPIKTTEFPLFTDASRFSDDTVMTVATADVLLRGGDYAAAYRRYFRLYPYVGFGGAFIDWGNADDAGPYGSWGNGSAMRVSPIAWARDDLGAVLREAERSAAVSHDHPEGIKGAQAAAAAVYLARTGADKRAIKSYVESTFGYALDEPLDDLRARYRFDVSCQGTMPAAFIAFLAGEDWEESVRIAVSLGGDADTLAAIVGGIAEAFYGGVPPAIAAETERRLDDALRGVVREFRERFPCRRAAD